MARESIDSVLLSSASRLCDEGTEAFLEYALSEIARLAGASTLFLLRYDSTTRLLALHLTYLKGKLRWGLSGEEFSILTAPFSADITPAFEVMCQDQCFLTSANCPIPAEEFALPRVADELAARALSDSAHLALMVGDRPVGSLSLEFEDGRTFQEAHRPLVQALAKQMAIALRLANAAEQERQGAGAVAQEPIAREREREKAAQERATELAKANHALRRGVERLSTDQRLESLLSAFLDEAVNAVGGRGGAVMLRVSGAGATYRPAAVYQGQPLSPEEIAADPYLGRYLQLYANEPGGILTSLTRDETPGIRVDDLQELFPDAYAYHHDGGDRIIWHTPLLLKGEISGFVGLALTTDMMPSEAARETVAALAQQCVLALELTRLAEEAKQAAVANEQEKAAQERSVELEQINNALRRGVERVTGEMGLEMLLGSLLLEAMQVSGAAGGGITGWKQGQFDRYHCIAQDGAIVPSAAWEQEAMMRETAEALGRDAGGFASELLSTPVSRLRVDDAWDWWPASAEYHTRRGHVEVWNVPCVLRGELVAHLGLAFREPRSIVEATARTLTALAQQMTLALELTRLAEEAKRAAITKEQEKAAQIRAAELAGANEELKREVHDRQRAEQVSRGQTEAMIQALNVLAAETDISAFLSHVLCAIATQLNTQMCALYFYDRTTDLISLRMTYHYGQTLQGDEQAGNPSAGNPHRPHQDGFWTALVQTRRPVIIPDVSQDPFFHQFTWLSLNGIQSLFSVPLVLGEAVIGYLVVRSKERHDYAPEEVELAQALAHQITLAVNTTRLAEAAKQAAIHREKERAAQERAAELARINHALRLEIEERQRAELLAQGQLQALNHTLQTFAHEPELDRFLGYVLCALTEQLGEQSGTIWLYDPRWEATVLHTELHDGQLQHFPMPAPNDITSRWDQEFLPHLRSRQILIHTETDFATHAAYFAYQQYFAERGIRTILNIPLVAGENFLGIFAVRSKILRGYTSSELELAQALAHQAVLAIQITRLAEVAKQTAAVKAERAVLEERNRLAQEIHDTLAHNFTSLKFLLEAAELTGALPPALAPVVAQAREMAGEGAKEARRSVWALRPEALERGDLLSALSAVIEQRTRETTLDVELRVEGELFELRPEVEDNLLRVSQEALANVVKHAQTAQARVTLTFAAPGVTLRVSDGGNGFDPQIKSAGTGLGLIGMRERITRLGGKLSVESASGAGTEIRALIPKAERPGTSPASLP